MNIASENAQTETLPLENKFNKPNLPIDTQLSITLLVHKLVHNWNPIT